MREGWRESLCEQNSLCHYLNDFAFFCVEIPTHSHSDNVDFPYGKLSEFSSSRNYVFLSGLIPYVV